MWYEPQKTNGKNEMKHSERNKNKKKKWKMTDYVQRDSIKSIHFDRFIRSSILNFIRNENYLVIRIWCKQFFFSLLLFAWISALLLYYLLFRLLFSPFTFVIFTSISFLFVCCLVVDYVNQKQKKKVFILFRLMWDVVDSILFWFILISIFVEEEIVSNVSYDIPLFLYIFLCVRRLAVTFCHVTGLEEKTIHT